MTLGSSLTTGVLCVISIAGVRPATGAGEKSSQLEQQLQELKQQYAQAMRALEQRIAALEQQIERAAAATRKEAWCR